MSKKVVNEAVVEGIDEEVKSEAVKSEAEKLEAFKAAKRKAAKRWKERKAKEKEEFLTNVKALCEAFKSNGIWEQLTPEQQSFLDGCANPVAHKAVASTRSSNSIFAIVFGAEPKVGDKVTLTDVFQKTLKGKAQFDAKVKAWANDGIIISYQEDAANLFNSTYTIEALNASTITTEASPNA